MSEHADECEQLIKDCENRIDRLEDGDREFIEAISSQVKAGEVLNEYQAEYLDELWEKATEGG